MYRILLVAIAVMAIGGIAVNCYVGNYYRADSIAEAAIDSDRPAYSINLYAGVIAEAVMTWQILATKCLRVESMRVYDALYPQSVLLSKVP